MSKEYLKMGYHLIIGKMGRPKVLENIQAQSSLTVLKNLLKNMQINDLEFKTTLVTQTNNILEIVLNRPDKKNAINPTMTNELLYA